jgi:hypothetical protein
MVVSVWGSTILKIMQIDDLVFPLSLVTYDKHFFWIQWTFRGHLLVCSKF